LLNSASSQTKYWPPSILRLVDARLHWGKHFPLEYQDIASLYPRLAEFRALCRSVDPAGVLRNGYTARVLDLPGPVADARGDRSGRSIRT
jgi:hypothetical protein